jgi:hypothetical protein
MSIFNWFSRPATQANPAPAEEHHRSNASHKKTGAASPQEPEVDQRSDRSKARHLRRDQLFVAIREAMTRTGLLPSNYKFKVISEDQKGDEFVVMMSLVTVVGEPLPAFSEIEAMIMDSAQVRFEIVVSAVYWRLTEVAAPAKFVPPPLAMHAPAQPPVKPSKPKSPHETIEVDEVVAFQQALLAASAQGHSAPPEKGSEIRRKKRSSTQMKDFQDTEMVESKPAPILSKTQYGDLM